MGRRVYIKHLASHMPFGVPGAQQAFLSCGHRGGQVSFFASTGEPIWCETCEAPCLGCGAKATECRSPSWEWGESCASCLALDEEAWCRAVARRRLILMSVDEHLESAAHFVHAGLKCEREAVDPKHQFWESPPHLTRAAHVHLARELLVKSAMHVLYAFGLGER